MAYRIVDTLVPGSANKFPVVDVVNVSIKDQYLDAYLDNLNGTIITLSAAVEDLRKRIVALENGTVAALDKTKINSLITQANSLNEENYTTDSWESLEVAYAAAIKARDEATTQGELDEAALALEQAIADLEKISETTVDKTALAIVISEVNKLNEANYSVPSWDALEDAKTTAETVYADSTVTQTRVDEATNNLQTARDNLLDISGLKDAIQRAQGYDEADYTSDSWEELQTALVNAESVLNSANADIEGETQTSVNDAAANLKNACDSLVPKTGSTGIVDTIIANETSMYSISATGELTEIPFKLLNFDTTTASAEPTESGFYQITDSAGNVIESGYQELQSKSDETYYVIALPKEIDYHTMVTMQAYSTALSKWMDAENFNFTNESTKVAAICAEAGIDISAIDTEIYSVWAVDECPTGSKLRFIITE